MCGTYICDYLLQTKFRFYLIDFQLKADFSSQFGGFFFFSPSDIQRLVSQQKAFYKDQNPVDFSSKTIGSNNPFTRIENSCMSLRWQALNLR